MDLDPAPQHWLKDLCLIQAAGMVWAEQASAEGPGSGGQGARPTLHPQHGLRPHQDAEGRGENQVRYQCAESGSALWAALIDLESIRMPPVNLKISVTKLPNWQD